MGEYVASVPWQTPVLGVLRDLGQDIHCAAIEDWHREIQEADDEEQEDAYAR